MKLILNRNRQRGAASVRERTGMRACVGRSAHTVTQQALRQSVRPHTDAHSLL